MANPQNPTGPMSSENRPVEQTLPARCYTEADSFAAEQRQIFRKCWQVVALSAELSAPGQFIATELAGAPVLLVRQETGELRGFFNLCRHRAATLVGDSCGEASRFRCPYHGWTYSLTGELIGVPDGQGLPHSFKQENGLVPLGAVQEVGPFVWACWEQPSEPLQTFLHPFQVWWDDKRPMTGLRHFARREYPIRCNWKVAVDNYLDGGYHLPAVHPGLSGALDFRRYRTEIFDSCSVQYCPASTASDAEPTRQGEAAYWWLFPNFMLNAYDGVVDTNRVIAVNAEECLVVFDFFFRESASDSFVNDSIAIADKVQQEDSAICERVQKGLDSGAFHTGPILPHRELAVARFHRLIEAATGQS